MRLVEIDPEIHGQKSTKSVLPRMGDSYLYYKYLIINRICFEMEKIPPNLPPQGGARAMIRAFESAFPYLVSAPKPSVVP
jgi:hypothetical protein